MSKLLERQHFKDADKMCVREGIESYAVVLVLCGRTGQQTREVFKG